MNLKKILAGVLACCVMGGTLPSVARTADNAVIMASAADEYTEGTEGVLTYRIYNDHIEITGCDESATSVIIPAEIDGVPVTRIGSYAFDAHSGLTEITIPNSVTSIGDYAFHNCLSLTSITIPDSVTSIGGFVFEGCSELTSINVSDNNAVYADINGVLFNKEKTVLISYPNGKSETTYTIPNSVTRIGSYTFRFCERLTKITIPDSVTSIGDGAFEGCSGLTEVTIPDSVTSIGDYAFDGCSGLTEVTIPDSVTSIGNAFSWCSELTEFTILNPNCEIYDDEATISNGRDDEYDNYHFNGTIYGYENSTAQKYAVKYNRNFVSLGKAPNEPSEEIPLGDVNNSGEVDAVDASLVLADYAAVQTGKKGNFTAEQRKAADVNGDGAADAIDASKILAYYAYYQTGHKVSFKEFLAQ